MKELREWYQSKQGQLVASTETRLIEKVLPRLFGYHLLQLGATKNLSWLKNSPILHRFGVSPCQAINRFESWVQANHTALPFAESSIDVLILPHLLEVSFEPLPILQEASRVLLAEGKLILFGFNPWHPWYWFNTPKLNANYSLSKIKRLLKEADLTLSELRWLHYGAIYYIQAKKSVFCITPHKQSWQHKVTEKGLIQPTAHKEIGVSRDSSN